MKFWILWEICDIIFLRFLVILRFLVKISSFEIPGEVLVRLLWEICDIIVWDSFGNREYILLGCM